MSRGGRCPRRHRWSHRPWSRRRHGGGVKICDVDDAVDCNVKPADVGIESAAKDSICVRDRPGRSRLRVDAEGNLYVLDSEEEDSAMEVNAGGAVAAEGVEASNGANLFVDGSPVAAAGAAGEDVPLGPPVVTPDDAARMELAPEVAARLKEVLANMDPIYHDVFISMYKIMIIRW